MIQWISIGLETSFSFEAYLTKMVGKLQSDLYEEYPKLEEREYDEIGQQD